VRRRVVALVLLCLCAFVLQLSAGTDGEECTTMVAAGGGTRAGGPMMWKNRDTGQLSNKLVYVAEQPYSFLSLVDATDTAARASWGGVNVKGFALANSASYNLSQTTGETSGQEGLVMADALRTCRNLAEFEAFINRRVGRGFGVHANFFAIDAEGGAAIFETHPGGYTRFDAAAAPAERLANTNFSRSGKEDQGAGYLRFDRETTLLERVAPGTLDALTIFQTFSRDLGHALLQYPGREEWKKLPADKPYWVHSNYTIDRPSTAGAIVVQGVKAGQEPTLTTLWVALGEPVTTIAVPVWVVTGQSPAALSEGKDAAISVEAARLKALLRPLKSKEKNEYADVTKLDNAAGTGWLPTLLATEREIMADTEALLKKNPSVAELTAFQNAAAEKALAVLQKLGR
jgi:hypothetical protein